MNLRRRAVLAPLAVLTIFALALAWENRASEKVWTAVLAPVVLAAGYVLSRWFLPGAESWVTAWLGALVAFAGILAFTPPLQYTRVMMAMFLMRTADRQPVSWPRALMPPQLPVMIAMHNAPPHIWTADNDRGVRVYHHLLQRAILEALRTADVVWGAEGESFANWGGRFQIAKGTTI